jgi:pSer/pThr/pTyr-binding forkhead associated (FHA) protein
VPATGTVTESPDHRTPFPSGGAHPRLATVRPDGLPGFVFPLDREETVCGRTLGDVLLSDDPTVSPRHARFTVGDGHIRLEDLGSVAGTFVRLRSPRPLGMGDEFRVGRQLLRLEPLPSEAPAGSGVTPWGSPDPGFRMRLAQLLDGGGLGEIFPLRAGENVIGREAGDVVFPADRYVSGRHARIDVAEGSVTLTDLGSSNGTFYKISGAVDLQPGDQLLVGRQLLRVEL